jgi:hypothetical protein
LFEIDYVRCYEGRISNLALCIDLRAKSFGWSGGRGGILVFWSAWATRLWIWTARFQCFDLISGDKKGQVSREEWERIAERSREERGKAVS